MANADRETYCAWVQKALHTLGRGTPRQVADWIKSNEAVPLSELAGVTSDGENLFYKNVRWARFTLYKKGVVSNRAGRGIWTLA